MKIISSKKKLIKFIHNEKDLGFVPTMGSIHLGHISLIRRSKSECQKTLVTIFINKPQFNNARDYRRYPRKVKKDIKILKKNKVDYLYMPSFNQIYPNGRNRKIKIDSFSKKLCGKFRPGHFEAIADVIDRFIKIIQPIKIYFGEKDQQQLMIIKKFITENHKITKVVSCRTIREKNGVAFSSRNLLLSDNEKKIASEIYAYLVREKKKLIKNLIKINEIKKNIIKYGAKKIEYIEILNINKIIKPHKKNKKYKIFIAYYLGTTRLIDNI